MSAQASRPTAGTAAGSKSAGIPKQSISGEGFSLPAAVCPVPVSTAGPVSSVSCGFSTFTVSSGSPCSPAAAEGAPVFFPAAASTAGPSSTASTVSSTIPVSSAGRVCGAAAGEHAAERKTARISAANPLIPLMVILFFIRSASRIYRLFICFPIANPVFFAEGRAKTPVPGFRNFNPAALLFPDNLPAFLYYTISRTGLWELLQ